MVWETARDMVIDLQSRAMQEPREGVVNIPVCGRVDVASTVIGSPCAGDVTLITFLFDKKG